MENIKKRQMFQKHAPPSPEAHYISFSLFLSHFSFYRWATVFIEVTRFAITFYKPYVCDTSLLCVYGILLQFHAGATLLPFGDSVLAIQWMTLHSTLNSRPLALRIIIS